MREELDPLAATDTDGMRASTRWRSLVRARLSEMERLAPGRGAVGAAFWNSPGRARRFHAGYAGTTHKDPLFVPLRRSARRSSTVVDVGAGTGRFSLALAPRVAQVIAVDPSEAMLRVLRREARRQSITNVRCVKSRWQDVELAPDVTVTAASNVVPPADLLVCSYVLPLVEDASPFLARMDAACRGRAFVFFNAMSNDALSDPFWRHFHGKPRRPAPTYLDAVAVLRELGVEPDVEIIEIPALARYKSLDDAVKSYRESLLLHDSADIRAELRSMLRSWLVGDGDGLKLPIRTFPAASISWAGGAGRR